MELSWAPTKSSADTNTLHKHYANFLANFAKASREHSKFRVFKSNCALFISCLVCKWPWAFPTSAVQKLCQFASPMLFISSSKCARKTILSYHRSRPRFIKFHRATHRTYFYAFFFWITRFNTHVKRTVIICPSKGHCVLLWFTLKFLWRG